MQLPAATCLDAQLVTALVGGNDALADLWAHTGPPYRGLYFDGFHPNHVGYAQWVSALEAALQQGGHLPE